MNCIRSVVLDMDGETLSRNEARTFCHGPAFHNSIQFEPEVVMESARRVLLDHIFGHRLTALATRGSGVMPNWRFLR